MKGFFSKYLKKKKEILKKLIELLNKNYAYVSILATDVSGQSISVDKFSTSVVPSSSTECGFVIKVFHNGIYSEYSTNDINEKNLNVIIENINALTSFNFSIPKENISIIQEDLIVKKFQRKHIGKIYSCEEIIDNCKQMINTSLKETSNIVNCRIGIENLEVSKMFLSTQKDLEQYYTWTTVRNFILVRKDNQTKYAYDGFGSNNLEDLFTKLEQSIVNTGKLANELLGAVLPTPGIYNVITDPGITGLIAHEAFGHGVEMDMFVKDRALAKEYINKPVASKLISMHDGAKAAYSVASYFFDDDGVLAQDTKIIEKGILKRGISDSLSACELGTIPTGNGRRQSYKRKSYTRMTNTFFEKGKDSLDDMIKSIEYGYYISTTNNGMEDPKNWGIQCTALYGKEIVNGEFTGKIISPVVMSGNVIDLLKSITAVSKDFVVTGSGSCGKGYKEWVRVSDGGPYLKARVKIG